jgi:uncharacterized protein (DUF433 family)
MLRPPRGGSPADAGTPGHARMREMGAAGPMLNRSRESWMRFPESPYISQEDGALRIAGTRVGLSSIIAGFQEGESPEKLAQEFPAVTLAQLYGAIAYDLDNKKVIDGFFAEVDREFFGQAQIRNSSA